MLRLLLDEHISQVVAHGLTARRPDITITSVHTWRNGAMMSQPDHLLLQAAAEEGLTVVTYDVSTIRPMIEEWRARGQSHAGVIFVPARTIRSDDFGGLIRALIDLWDRDHAARWTNRMQFLRPR